MNLTVGGWVKRGGWGRIQIAIQKINYNASNDQKSLNEHEGLSNNPMSILKGDSFGQVSVYVHFKHNFVYLTIGVSWWVRGGLENS